MDAAIGLKDDDPTDAVAKERERDRQRKQLVQVKMATCVQSGTVHTPKPKGTRAPKEGLRWSDILAAFVPKKEG